MERNFDNSDFDVPLGPIFDTRTGNEWLADTKKLPTPAKLLGDMWVEGEMALLLSDHGLGRSILGVQIGESIARGEPIEPFEMTAKPQPVVLLDLEMSGRQFLTRYVADDDDDEAADYDFSADFHRTRVDPYAPLPKGCKTFSDYLCRAARQLCLEKGAKVLIVDGISQLKHSNDASRDLLPLMKGLDRLRRDEAIAIIVLVPARNRLLARSLEIRTLMGANLICERADSVIAIGRSEHGVKHRYIKHLRSKGAAIRCDKTNVAAFRIEKFNGNFLGFVFEGFSPESDHFEPRAETYDWEMIDRIKRLHDDDDMTFRDIAAEVGLSKSTVCEMYHKWRARSAAAAAAAAGAVHDPTTSEYYFPGREEYDEAGRDPRFNGMYSREDDEGHRLRREAYLIELACANARKEYKRTGTAPKLAEMLQRMKDAETAAAAAGSVSVPPVVAGGLTHTFEELNEPEEPLPDELNTNQLQPPATAGGSDKTRGLKAGLDEYGREIFIEEEDCNGKRRIWYERDKKGHLFRKVRRLYDVLTEPVDDE